MSKQEEILAAVFQVRLNVNQTRNLGRFLTQLFPTGQDISDQFRSFCDWLGGANYSLEEMVKLHEENNFAYFKQEKLKQLCICHTFKIHKGSRSDEVEFYCSRRCRLLPATFQRCKDNRRIGLAKGIITHEDLKKLDSIPLAATVITSENAAPFPTER